MRRTRRTKGEGKIAREGGIEREMDRAARSLSPGGARETERRGLREGLGLGLGGNAAAGP